MVMIYQMSLKKQLNGTCIDVAKVSLLNFSEETM